MSGSNRIKRFALIIQLLGYLLIGYIIVIIGVLILMDSRAQQLEKYSQYQNYSASQRTKSAQAIEQTCSLKETATLRKNCIISKLEARETQKNTNQDLQAQQDMAYWAKWLFILTVGTFITSIGGLLLLLRSLRQTETAITDNRIIGQSEVRAYVSLLDDAKDIRAINLTKGRKPSVEFSVKNYGSTPAKSLGYIAYCKFLTHETVNNFKGDMVLPDENNKELTITLQSGNTLQFEAFCEKIVTTENIRKMVSNSDASFYLIGVIHYKDVFNVPHKTQFCFHLRSIGLTEVDGEAGHNLVLVGSPNHNDAT